MANDLLRTWLGWWQPIAGGLSETGVANGLLLTGGWFWARVRGGYLLYRGLGGWGNIDWDRPVGAAAADAGEVREFGWMARGPAGGYWYGVRKVGGGGAMTAPGGSAVGCGVDETGQLVGPLPGDVERVWARQAGQGRVLVCWCYGGPYETARPVAFHIYGDGGTGQVNYGQPIATVAWDLRRQVYGWLSSVYAVGERVRFGVRAATAGGEGSGCEVEVRIGGESAVWPAVMMVEGAGE